MGTWSARRRMTEARYCECFCATLPGNADSWRLRTSRRRRSMSLDVMSTACSVFSNFVSSMACSLGAARCEGRTAPPADLCIAISGAFAPTGGALPLAACAPFVDLRRVRRDSDWEAIEWTKAVMSFAVNLRSLKHLMQASVARLVPSGSSRSAWAMMSSVRGAGRTGTPGTAVFLRMPTAPVPVFEDAAVAITPSSLRPQASSLPPSVLRATPALLCRGRYADLASLNSKVSLHWATTSGP
mmetsp:Transcript_30061/g.75677  ORF Transcript_30061/g.75677 Transcript_30061/m.75677 type:complete len:242 (-) Transcript_30061:29-754(-)